MYDDFDEEDSQVMNLIHVTFLTAQQKNDMVSLVDACKKKEPLALSAPSEDGLDYFLLYKEEGTSLLAFAFLFFPTETACECALFVHPDHRRKGLCSRLLDEILPFTEQYEKKTHCQLDFCFLVDEHTPSAVAVMEALEAEYWYSEHKMIREPKQSDQSYAPTVQITEAEPGLYTAALQDAVIGTCAILPSGEELYLYAFQIKEEYQGQGWGKDFLLGMLALLSAKGSAVSLQVSGQNYIARNLYKKAGFHTVESLAYYIY